MQRRPKRFGRKLPVVARQRRDLESAERGMRAAFAGDDMRAAMGQDFIARPAMGQGRRDVAHGARRHEHGRLLAEQAGDPLAQQIHGRVIADLLVADLRPRHRLAHCRRRARLRIREQVDADGGGLGIARGRGVVHGSLAVLLRWVGDLTQNKRPRQNRGLRYHTNVVTISANRIRRSDAAPSAPQTARPTARGCG